MSIPIISFLYLYLAYLLIYALFSFFHIYHLLRFVAPSAMVYFLIILYILLSLVIISATAVFLVNIDWSQTIDILSESSLNIYD